jgi:hypothetical protein
MGGALGSRPFFLAGFVVALSNHIIMKTTTRNPKLSLSLSLSILLCAVTLHAQIIFQDSFNYPAGQPLGSEPLWTSSGSGNDISVVAGNLATAGIQSPVGNSIALARPGESDFTTFATQTTATYYSFALRVVSLGTMTTAGACFAGFTDGGTGRGCALWLRRDSGNPNNFDFGFSVRDFSDVQWNNGWALGQYHVFGLYDFGVNWSYYGMSDVADAWIDSNPSSPSGVPQAGQGSVFQVAFAQDLPQVGGFFFSQGAGSETPVLIVDELRVGKTWANVTPIPDLPTASRTANGFATLVGSSVVGASIADGGYGYTNTPTVRIVGGGGTGAQAVAVVSNRVVIAVNVLDAGYGYTSAPTIVIEPPFIPNPILSIAPMSLLSFSNLTVGGVYQLQRSVAWYWSNQPVSFTAATNRYAQMVAGVAGSGDYRLALNPVPAQAFATSVVSYGFVVHATVTSAGSGYVTSPAVTIVGGGGMNAGAVANLSGGVVASITITNAGIGYTNTPTVRIAPPPAASISPSVLPVMRVDSTNLAPYENYQVQCKSGLGGTWGNWDGGLFSSTGVTNSQFLFITNRVGFFRLQYVP